MEIEYVLTEDDLLAFNLYRLLLKRGRHDPILIRRFAYLAGFSFIALGTWLLGSQAIIPITFLSMAFLSFILYPIYFNWSVRRKVSATYRDPNNSAMFAPHLLRATSEGLEEKSGVGEMKVKWEVVDGITITTTHVFISIQNTPSVVIPKDHISRGDFQSFLKICQENTKVGTA